MNDDPRYLATKQILENVDEYLPTMLLKTTRAGATTGLTANCIDTGLVPLLIAPTKKISHETIKESIRYSQFPDANIQVLLSNHECILNKIMVKEYPDVGKIPILPLPKKCSKCKYFEECPVTELIRSDKNDVDGIGITYQKLKAIMFSDSETANMIKGRLAECDVIIFDEAHIFESPDTASIQVYPHTSLRPYQLLFKDNDKISPFLERYAQIVHDKQTSIMQLAQMHDDAEQNLMMIKLRDNGDEQMDFKNVVGAIKEIIKIMKKRDKYNLSAEEVVYIFNIIMLFAADKYVLHYIKSEEGGVVYLSTVDSLLPAIRMFRSTLDPSKKRKVIFTTATFGDFNYTGAFGLHDQMLMPDVMKANQRMTIYPDTFKMDDINYRAKNWNRIVDTAEEYEKKYPGITFVCMKKNVAWWLHARLEERGYDITTDYYRSTNMIGVSSSERRCVCVGSPVSPINTYDGVSETYIESQKRRVGNNHAAFWQAISRFKSPSGTQDTEIYCIGITEQTIHQMVKWGTDRKLSMDKLVCTGVEVGNAFDEPVIVSKDRRRVVDAIIKNPGITRTGIMDKLRMKSGDVKKCVETLLAEGCISGKNLKIKRKPIGYFKL